MKLKNPMLVVTNMDRSVAFYQAVLGLHVVLDFGANKTLTGGLALQTLETYREFLGTDQVFFGGNDFEVYFEEDDLQQSSPSAVWSMSILSRSTPGASGLYASMTQTDTSLRWART